MNFNEPFQDIKEKPKHHGWTDRKIDRQTDVKTEYPPQTVCGGRIIKKTNIKMAKFEKQLFNQKKNFWHDTSSCTCSIHVYLSIVSVKALVQVEFPIYAQAKSLFKSKQEKKKLISQSCYFVKKNFFWIKLLHANVQ